MQVSFQSQKTLPYGKFRKGNNIVTGNEQRIGYWTGRNDIRHDGKSHYICIAGTDTNRGTTFFVERVYKIDSEVFEANREWFVNNIDDLIEQDGKIVRYSDAMGFND